MDEASRSGARRARGPGRIEAVLLAQQARLLRLLERRLGSRADAEEVLQGAYVRALERGVPDDGDEGVVRWFTRVLRNAVVDRSRRRGAEARAAERLARELDAPEAPELRDAVCACLRDLLPGLKAEYADVVRAVDLEERPLADVAAERAITVNNATVRLHRARKALKAGLLRACGACAAHGCLECACRTARSDGAGRRAPGARRATLSAGARPRGTRRRPSGTASPR
jgi:RNA polymerase sigma-70 factor (ECF subfamily)